MLYDSLAFDHNEMVEVKTDIVSMKRRTPEKTISLKR